MHFLTLGWVKKRLISALWVRNRVSQGLELGQNTKEMRKKQGCCKIDHVQKCLQIGNPFSALC